jgi:tRNA threonylcarbamoyl adenosine modification protein YeaZ/ribosomal-protein-alanine acetyltransferase
VGKFEVVSSKNILLVIDTSSTRTSVAIIQDRKPIISLHHDDSLAHGEVLPRLVAKALEVENRIDQVIIGMGPGPFTGLRVGISFAQIFALGRNLPWLGLCSLDAIVDPSAISATKKYLVATDARRKEIYWAKYENGRRIFEPHVSAPQTIQSLGLPAFGEGAIKYGFSQNMEFLFPNPILMANLISTAKTYSLPLYLRRPDAYPAPHNVKFRAMTAQDLESVFAMELLVYENESPWSLGQFEEELNGKNRWYLIAEQEGKIIGYVGALFIDQNTDITTLTVHPEFRKKGIGRELLRRLIDWARTQRSKSVMLEMRIGNLEAEPLYLAFGFVEISRRSDYYGPGLNALVMRKDLV